MRILILNQYYPPDAANSAKMLAHLVEALEVSHDVTIIAGRPSYNSTHAAKPPPGRVIRVTSTTFTRASLLGRVVNYLSYMILCFARSMLRRRPDLILTMTDPPMVGLLGVAAAMRYRRPLVQISQDVYPEIAVAVGAIRSQRLKRAWQTLNSFIRSRATGIVVIGRDMEELLAQQGVPREKLQYVPMWAEDQTLSEDQREQTRKRMAWRESFVIMHAGNIGPAQNLNTVLDAAALNDDPKVLFVFLGDGASRQGLERRVDAEALCNVFFLDYAPQEQAQELMAAADVHVVSLMKGLGPLAAPSKTYGILAAGRPYIAAVDEGSEPARIVQEEGCGVICVPNDGAALANAIVEIRAMPLPEIARRAREAFDRRFQRRDVTTSLVRVIEGMVDQSVSSQR